MRLGLGLGFSRGGRSSGLTFSQHLALSEAQTIFIGDSYMTGGLSRVPHHLLRGLETGGRITAIYSSHSPASNGGMVLGGSISGSSVKNNNQDGFIGGTEFYGLPAEQIIEEELDGTVSTSDGALVRWTTSHTVLAGCTNDNYFDEEEPTFFRPLYYCPEAGVTELSNIDWDFRAAQGSTNGTSMGVANLREQALDLSDGTAGAPDAGEYNALVKTDGTDWYSAYYISSSTRVSLCHPSGGTQSPNDNTWVSSPGALIYAPNATNDGWLGGHAVSFWAVSSASFANVADNLDATAGVPKNYTIAQASRYLKLTTPPGGENLPVFVVAHFDAETTSSAEDLIAIRNNLAAAAALQGRPFSGVLFWQTCRKASITLEQDQALAAAMASASAQVADINYFSLGEYTDWIDFNAYGTDATTYLSDNGFTGAKSFGGTTINITTAPVDTVGHPNATTDAAWICYELERYMARAEVNNFTPAQIEDLTLWLDADTDATVISDGAAQFTAANSEYLSRATNASLNHTGDFAYAGWVYADSDGQKDFISKWGTSPNLEVLFRRRTTGDHRLQVFTSPNGTSTENQIYTGGTIPTGAWTFVYVGYDSASDQLTINLNNGTPETSTKQQPFAGATAFHLGATPNLSIYWDGRMDSFGKWDRVLTTAEQTALYNAGTGVTYLDLSDTEKTDLVSWWDLDEVSGTRLDSHGTNDLTDNNTVTTANGIVAGQATDGDPISLWSDKTANGNDATQATAGRKPLLDVSTVDCLEFDGSNDFLTIGALGLTENQPQTISAWFKTSETDGAYVYSSRDGAVGGLGLYLQLTTGRLTAVIGITEQLAANTTINDGLWHHGVIVYDGLGVSSGSVIYYIDGVVDGTDNSLAGTWTDTTDSFVGARGNGDGGSLFPLNGQANEILVYERALTAAQVLQLYNSSRARYL